MRYHIPVWAVLFLASSMATAATREVDPGSDPSASGSVTRASSAPSADRVAAIQTTLAKRKAKKARDHAAYTRASAEANAMKLALSGRGPAPALRSVAAQDPRANGPRAADGAQFSQGGQGYGQGAGGRPPCAARPQ